MMNRMMFFLPVTLLMGLMFCPLQGFAQTSFEGQTLAKVAFVLQPDRLGGYPITLPVFDPEVKQLASQEVEIRGYVLPVDTDGKQYVLSAFPYASCFFGGGAGRESVIALDLQPGHRRFMQDEYFRFRGQLTLSEEEYDLIYRLVAAKVVE